MGAGPRPGGTARLLTSTPVARHEPDDVTEAVNRVIEDLGEDAVLDGFTKEAVRQVLESSEW